MKLALITGRPGLPTNRRLGTAATLLGLEWSWKHPLLPALRQPDIVLTRLGLSWLDEGLELTQHYASLGVTPLNTVSAIRRAKDKWQSYQAFKAHSLPTVPTQLKQPGDPAELIDNQATVVKTLYGSKGVGVHCAETHAEVNDISKRYHNNGYNVLLQPRLTIQQEWRVLIAGGTIIATVTRESDKKNFRSNWHQGARLHNVDATPAVTQLALAGATALGLNIAGMDLVETAAGLQLLEANDSPGLTGIEAACGCDLATPLLEAAIAATDRN